MPNPGGRNMPNEELAQAGVAGAECALLGLLAMVELLRAKGLLTEEDRQLLAVRLEKSRPGGDGYHAQVLSFFIETAARQLRATGHGALAGDVAAEPPAATPSRGKRRRRDVFDLRP